MSGEIVSTEHHNTDPIEVNRFTQQMRYRMFDELTVNGTNLSVNIKESMQLLRDMDTAALTSRKLDIDQAKVDTAGQTLESFHRLEEMLQGRNPFELTDKAPLPIAERVRPALPENLRLPSVTLLDGEDAQGEQALSIHHYVPSDD